MSDLLALTGGAIGQGLPTAVGAAIACPDRPVLALVGELDDWTPVAPCKILARRVGPGHVAQRLLALDRRRMGRGRTCLAAALFDAQQFILQTGLAA